MGTEVSECAGNTGDCNYQTSTTMPVVTSVEKTDSNTLDFTGTGFNIADFSASVILANVSASEVTILSDTQVRAIYSYGVPLTTGAVSPILAFIDTTDPSVSHSA